MEDEPSVSHPHDGMLVSLKGKEILPLAITWMNLEDIELTGISQSQKRQILPDFTYRTSLESKS